jgi:hypothetical protein
MRLIKKNIIFIFNENYKEAFKEFKIRLISAPILNHYNLKQKIILKFNTLNDVIAEIFL